MARALVIDHKVPQPDRDSGSSRMFEILRLLGQLGLRVSFVPEDGERPAGYTEALEEQGVEVLEGPAAVVPFLERTSRELRLAVVSRPPLAWNHYPTLRERAPGAALVYDTVDLHFLRERRMAEYQESPEVSRSAAANQQIETTLAGLYDATWTVTETEAALLSSLVPGCRPFVVPNVHRTQRTGPGFDERRDLLFVGSYVHPPNRDAAARLAREVVPMIGRRLPGVRLRLVGADADGEIRALRNAQVEVLGWVPDLGPLFHSSRLFVAPLSFGAGMKGKVGQSLSYGLPVVTSSIGAEGMGLRPGRDLLVADGPGPFADAVVAAYEDPLAWAELAACGHRAVARRYAPEVVRGLLGAILEELGALEPSETAGSA